MDKSSKIWVVKCIQKRPFYVGQEGIVWLDSDGEIITDSIQINKRINILYTDGQYFGDYYHWSPETLYKLFSSENLADQYMQRHKDTFEKMYKYLQAIDEEA